LHKMFSANVIGIAAVGIFASTATFSIVSGILIQPLPFRDAERVGFIQLETDRTSSARLAMDAYRLLEAKTSIFEAVAASSPGNTVLSVHNEPEQVRIELVTSSFARVYGIAPVLGRFFSESEAAARVPVLLLGYDAWQSRFRGDSSIVGQPISVDGAPYTVIGVMPPNFRATRASEPVLWLPALPGTNNNGAAVSATNAFVRLRPDVTVAAANDWLGSALTSRVESLATRDSVLARGRFVPVTSVIIGDIDRPLKVILGAVSLVVLLVATNLGTLFLVRAAAQSGEVALRRALGASFGRQLRASVTESTLLTGLGGVIGVVGAWWTVKALRTLGAGTLPRIQDVTLDWRVVVFASVSVMVAGVIAGFPRMAVTGGSRTVTPLRRLSSTLVTAQVTLSVLLLVGSGLLVKGFFRVLPSRPGFTVSHRAVVSMRVAGRSAFDASKAENVRKLADDIRTQMRAIDGVNDVAVSAYIPFVRVFSLIDVKVSGSTAQRERLNAFTNTVTPNYFAVMGIPIRAGRGFTELDRDGAMSVVMVNETAARRWWPGQSAVGQPVSFDQDDRAIAATVIGVAADARLLGTDTRIRPEMYVPLAQGSTGWLSFIVQTSRPPKAIGRELRGAVWTVVPGLPVESSTDLATLANESVRQARFFTTSLTAFALCAAVLAALGIYTLVAFGVTARRREIGIRIALGAPRVRVARLVVTQSAAVVGVGIVLGLIGARWLTQLMQSMLLEVTATDASVFATAAAVALGIAIVVGSIPTIRAVRANPGEVLRI
jgi:predicted permease